MPTATLKFDLPEEAEEFAQAVRGTDALRVLWILCEGLRDADRHGGAERFGLRAPLDEVTIEKLRAWVHDVMHDEGVDLGHLYP